MSGSSSARQLDHLPTTPVSVQSQTRVARTPTVPTRPARREAFLARCQQPTDRADRRANSTPHRLSTRRARRGRPQQRPATNPSSARVGSAAEMSLERETSPIVAVSGDVATLGICAVGAASSASSTFGTAVDSLAAAGEVIAEFRVEGVLMLVSECDLPLRCCRDAVAGESGEVRSFDVVGSVLEGAVDGVELSGESPVLTAVLGASDVVCAPVDVEDPVGELVEAAVGELGGSPGTHGSARSVRRCLRAGGCAGGCRGSRRGVSRRCGRRVSRGSRQRIRRRI